MPVKITSLCRLGAYHDIEVRDHFRATFEIRRLACDEFAIFGPDVVWLIRIDWVQVEDDVTAVLEYANGASGVFVTTTGASDRASLQHFVRGNGKVCCNLKSAQSFLVLCPNNSTRIGPSLVAGEAPGTNRLEIVGTKGRLVAEATPQILANARDPGGGAGGNLVFTKNKVDTDAGLRGEGSVGPVQALVLMRCMY